MPSLTAAHQVTGIWIEPIDLPPFGRGLEARGLACSEDILLVLPVRRVDTSVIVSIFGLIASGSSRGGGFGLEILRRLRVLDSLGSLGSMFIAASASS